MTRVEIFKKWADGKLTDEEAIKETKNAPKPIVHNDGYTEIWYEGEEENLTSYIRAAKYQGYSDEDITRFLKTIVSVADNNETKKEPNWKHAKELGMDTKSYKKMIKYGHK